MYGKPDSAVIDADRYYTEAETAAKRRADRVQMRALELLNLLRKRPLHACVVPVYGEGSALRDVAVPVGADFAGWVNETMGETDRSLAEAMYDSAKRGRLEARYALARAQHENPPAVDMDAALFGDLQ